MSFNKQSKTYQELIQILKSRVLLFQKSKLLFLKESR